jgi:hypothetical protein
VQDSARRAPVATASARSMDAAALPAFPVPTAPMAVEAAPAALVAATTVQAAAVGPLRLRPALLLSPHQLFSPHPLSFPFFPSRAGPHSARGGHPATAAHPAAHDGHSVTVAARNGLARQPSQPPVAVTRRTMVPRTTGSLTSPSAAHDSTRHDRARSSLAKSPATRGGRTARQPARHPTRQLPQRPAAATQHGSLPGTPLANSPSDSRWSHGTAARHAPCQIPSDPQQSRATATCPARPSPTPRRPAAVTRRRSLPGTPLANSWWRRLASRPASGGHAAAACSAACSARWRKARCVNDPGSAQ